MALYPLPIAKWTMIAIAVIFVLIIPMMVHEYYLSILNLIFIAIVGALGLNILVGYTGQISIGHGAFMSVGAYTAANLAVKLGLPFWLTLPAGGLMAALIGVVVGMPSLRIKGLYLAIATLAGQLIIEWTINRVPAISGGAQASIEVDRPSLFGFAFNTQGRLYFFLLFFAVIAIVATLNLVRSRIGPRLRGGARPGHRGRDHRHQHLPLQAARLLPSRPSTPASAACSTPTISASPTTSSSSSSSRSTISP